MTHPAIQEIVAVFGQPVAGNPTQYMMEKAFAQLGLDWRYLTLEVAPRCWAMRCADAGDGLSRLQPDDSAQGGCDPASGSHERSGHADGRRELRQPRGRRAGRRQHRRQRFRAVARGADRPDRQARRDSGRRRRGPSDRRRDWLWPARRRSRWSIAARRAGKSWSRCSTKR